MYHILEQEFNNYKSALLDQVFPLSIQTELPESVLSGGDIGFANVEFQEGNNFEVDRWMPVSEGIPALLFPNEYNGKIIDILAVDISDYDRIASRSGMGGLLGKQDYLEAKRDNRPLQVWMNPVNWLINGSNGVVPVDFHKSSEALLEINELLGENDEHTMQLACHLQDYLLEYKMPKIISCQRKLPGCEKRKNQKDYFANSDTKESILV